MISKVVGYGFAGLLVIAGNLRIEGAALPAPESSGIEHLVVVTMENRSFDHFLGWLPKANGKQAGLSYTNRDGTVKQTYPLAPDFQGCGHPDPDHSYEGGRIELNGGACDGWLRAGSNDVFSIGYYQQADLSFLGVAATNWTTCDHYFAAILAGTYPNRVYQHAAQTDRLDNTLKISSLPTIWDRLADKNLKGRYYFSDIPMLAIWGAKYIPIMRPIASFYDDAAAGNLPDVCYVEPRFLRETAGLSDDDHPVSDIRDGEAFLSRIYNAIVSSPNWTNTVMVINFDEWGGFFDHVVPSVAPIPDADKAAGNQDGYRGFRVPCVLISPWSGRGKVAHDEFDHTSVLKMIEWRWTLDPLTVRDQTARNLAEALNFDSYNTNAPLSVVPQGPFSVACSTSPLISISGTNLLLNWTVDARLQTTTSLTNAWQDVTNAVSGFTTNATDSARFFRLFNEWDDLRALAASYGIPTP
jgi:phospholipase C